MALLWRELADAAKTAPQAALGLVDIFMTAKPVNARATESLSREFKSAVLSTKSQLSNLDFWQFIIALVEKFQGRALPHGGIRPVRRMVKERAKTAPRDCFDALIQIDSKAFIPKVVTAAIGDGLTESEEMPLRVLNHLAELGSIGVEILSSSKRLGPHLISSVGDRNVGLSDALHSIVSRLESPDKRVLLRRAASRFSRAEQADVLNLLLQDTTPSTFLFVMQAIGRSTLFGSVELNSALIDAAKRTGSVSILKNALLEVSRSETTGRALADTLSLSREDFAWLANNVEDGWFRAWVIALLIDSTAEDRLQDFALNRTDYSSALLTLIREGIRYSTQIAHLLILPETEDSVLALHGLWLARETKSPDQLHSQLLSTLIRRLIGKPELLDDLLLWSISEEYAEDTSDKNFIDALFPDAGCAIGTIRALQVYHNGSETLKRKIHCQVGVVADRVLQVGLQDLNEAAIKTLAEIVEVSGDRNQSEQARASGRVLDVCFRSLHLPVGDLVIAAFPVVYSEVASGRPGFEFVSLFFSDWDHCKTIRRQLVDSYVNSVWAPIGLLICSWRVHDVYKVFRYLRKTYASQDYLRAVREDLSRYSGPNKAALSRALQHAVDPEWIDQDKTKDSSEHT